MFGNLKFITFELLITKKKVMVKVYFEMDNGGYAELVAIFDDEETYSDCFPALDKLRKKHGFDLITESIEDKTILELSKS